VGFSESRLSKERENVLRFYNSEKPYKAHHGDSTYMSSDVYEGVEQMKAQLLETFTKNNRPVSFSAARNETEDAARVRTDYVTDVIFRQNPGFSIFHDTIHDGLMGRAGVCKVWWDVRSRKEAYELNDASKDDLIGFLTQQDAKVDDFDLNEDGETFKRVRLTVTKDISQVKIDVIPPEEFLISPMAVDVDSADLIVHRQNKTISDLIKMGYPKAKVMLLQDNDKIWMQTEPELLARHEITDDLIGTKVLEDGQKARQTCMLYEAYLELDMDGEGTSELFKVDMVGDVVLDKERVDRKPFVCFIPLPEPHKFWGVNYAKLLIPTQTASTYLTRSIINHTLITNNPRWQVVRGAVANPRELMENRFGGIVNVARPDGVIPLPQSGLNPFVFQTINMLQDKRSRLTSVSDLSQGLNGDAVSKQNSQGMVQDLIAVSQIRQKVIARQFAERFLRHLYTMVYQLVLENESREKIVQVAGEWVPIDLTEWPEEADMSVEFALGYGEQEKEAQKWVGIDKYLSQEPGMQGFYPPQKRFGVVSKALLAMGVKNVSDVILSPQQVQPPPPNPMMQADIAVKQADAKVKLANAQAAVMKLQQDAQQMQLEQQDKVAKFQLETRNADAKIQLEQDKLAHKVAVDAAEISLERAAQAVDKLTAVAAPTRS
jgi:hypothetical protein